MIDRVILFLVRNEKRISTAIIGFVILMASFVALSCFNSWPSDDEPPPYAVIPYTPTAQCPEGYDGARYAGQGQIVCTIKAEENTDGK